MQLCVNMQAYRYMHYIATSGNESEDELWMAIVGAVGGGMLIINILTIIIISLYCKHHYSGKNDLKDKLNSPTKASMQKANPTYGSLPNKDITEKSREVGNAAYVSSSELGGTKPLDDTYTSVDTDYVTVKNPTDNSLYTNTGNVSEADVNLKSNPAYKMHSDRTPVDSAVYAPSYESVTQESDKPAVYDYASFDAKTASGITTDNSLTGANYSNINNPTYGNVATGKVNTDNPYY